MDLVASKVTLANTAHGRKSVGARGRSSTRVGYERPGFAWLLNAPALAALVLLAAYPIVSSAWISLHKYSLKRPRIFEFIELGNFQQLLGSDEFWSAFWVTLKFTALVVSLVITLGLLIALLLNRSFPGNSLVRTLLLIPSGDSTCRERADVAMDL